MLNSYKSASILTWEEISDNRFRDIFTFLERKEYKRPIREDKNSGCSIKDMEEEEI